MQAATSLFATLAEPIRLRCLALIARQGELCVCELVAALDQPQPKVSRHLAIMRDAGLLQDRRDAQWVLYALSPSLEHWAKAVVDAALVAISDDAQHNKDMKRLGKACRPARRRTDRAA
jgi:ArsR family transcriptional regulator